jgi:hypothetical protein
LTFNGSTLSLTGILQFPNAFGKKITLWDAGGGATIGLGAFSSEFRNFTDVAGTATTWGHYNGSTFTEIMRLDNANRRLGIGTSSPQTNLHVNSSLDSYIRVSGGSAQQQAVEFFDTAQRWAIYKPGSSTDLRFYSGADRMKLDSSGNVGIGANAGGTLNNTLQVDRDARSGSHGSSTAGYFTRAGNSNTDSIVECRHSNGTQGIGIGWNSINAVGSNSSQDIQYTTKNAGSHIFSDTTSGETMRLISSGRRLGIGTQNPVSRLTLNGGDSTNSIVLTNGSGNTTTRSVTGGVVSNEICGLSSMTTNGSGSDAGQLRLSAGGGTNAGQKSYIDLYGFASNFIDLGTAGTTRMRIDSSGNVRIGDGSVGPTQRLDVAGTIRGVGSIVNTLVTSASVGSWTSFTGSFGAGTQVTVATILPTFRQTTGNITMVIHASVELALVGGSGSDNLEWRVFVPQVGTVANFRINWQDNRVEGRGQGANNFGAGTAIVTIPASTISLGRVVWLQVSRNSDADSAFYSNAYLVVHELSNA